MAALRSPPSRSAVCLFSQPLHGNRRKRHGKVATAPALPLRSPRLLLLVLLLLLENLLMLPEANAAAPSWKNPPGYGYTMTVRRCLCSRNARSFSCCPLVLSSDPPCGWCVWLPTITVNTSSSCRFCYPRRFPTYPRPSPLARHPPLSPPGVIPANLPAFRAPRSAFRVPRSAFRVPRSAHPGLSQCSHLASRRITCPIPDPDTILPAAGSWKRPRRGAGSRPRDRPRREPPRCTGGQCEPPALLRVHPLVSFVV